MHIYEVIPGIHKLFSQTSSFKTSNSGYLRKQQNETGYFCGMTLYYTTNAVSSGFPILFMYMSLKIKKNNILKQSDQVSSILNKKGSFLFGLKKEGSI